MTDRPRLGVSVSFLVFGITVGGLIPRMPAFKDHLHLSDGQVGLALLGASLGGITGSLASRLLIRTHARRSVRIGTLVLCAVGITPGLASNLPLLMVSLYLVGFCWGFIDVMENELGAQLERERDAHLINGFHGFWSLGAFLGSIVAGAAAYAGIAPLPQLIATGAVLAAIAVLFQHHLPHRAVQTPASMGAGAVALTGLFFALMAMSFTGVIAEGGTSDWSALYLRELSHANPGVAAAGFSGFTVAATLVRFRADILTARTSRALVARLGALLAAGGLVLAIALPRAPTAILGFTLVGMGTAVVLPLVFAASANLGRSGTALAVVMASTYAGTIAGPPLIGTTADHFGLRVAMGIPLLAALLVALLAGYLGFPVAGEARRKGLVV